MGDGLLYITKRIKREFFDSCARIRVGSLCLTTPEGERHEFGEGTPRADMEIKDWSVVTAMASRGDIGLGETYVAGLWNTSSIERLITMALKNLEEFRSFAYPGYWNTLKFRAIDRLIRANSVRGAARNIRSHYDVGNDFYECWLDPSMTYSSALFDDDDDDLTRAQQRKYDRVLGRLRDRDRVLEIGCGWGGFAERAADEGRDVTALTISPSQRNYAQARLNGRASIRLQDYRHSDGKYDAIASIEMIEAVGERYWPSYFSTLRDRLVDDGRAVLQAITVPDSYFDIYRRGSDYIRQYTFPGGMLLSNAQIAEQARRAGLRVVNTFGFGEDYARTCRIWAERLEAQSDRIRALGYGEPFLRNWRYYLEICAASFATQQTGVVQVELSPTAA